jgi:hypothetical protein
VSSSDNSPPVSVIVPQPAAAIPASLLAVSLLAARSREGFTPNALLGSSDFANSRRVTDALLHCRTGKKHFSPLHPPPHNLRKSTKSVDKYRDAECRDRLGATTAGRLLAEDYDVLNFYTSRVLEKKIHILRVSILSFLAGVLTALPDHLMNS